ncbi:MAG: hypothetical protein O2819_00260 [Planctomycetota bacterium]|nr:hypothetical protein [Planctomycetota bacterium]MDA1105379.1 hypothetical protein [Planctomycetota bacterium]
MTSRSARLLLTLNAVLLVAVAILAFAPQAVAQGRARGQYMMVGGTAPGNSKGIVYITDTVAMEVLALQWDDNQRTFTGLGYRNIGSDANNATRSGGR